MYVSPPVSSPGRGGVSQLKHGTPEGLKGGQGSAFLSVFSKHVFRDVLGVILDPKLGPQLTKSASK